MVTADQIVAHLIGDYVLQSDWMATEKTRKSIAATAHALCYSIPFAVCRPSFEAWAFIVVTHFVIDRWRLARYVVWAKNWLAPVGFTSDRVPWIWQRPWRDCVGTGYPPDRPVWLATWLLIIADNTMHLLCNGIALRWM